MVRLLLSLLLAGTIACGSDSPRTPAAPTPTTSTNRAPTPTGSIPPQTMREGATVSLDAAQYFSDPDGDALTFEATSTDALVVTVSVSGSTVTVAGEYFGEAGVSVIARDPGGMTAAQRFDVTVEAAPTGPPPFQGTVFITPRLIGPSDPTSFRSVTFAGRGDREFWKDDRWTTINVYLFDVRYGASLRLEFQVHPEIGPQEAARAEVDTYAPAVGRLPAVLLSRAREVEISGGSKLFGGNTENGTFHVFTEQGKEYIRNGFLEEVFIHEGAHVSLDIAHANAAGWRAAQRADGAFISEYARDNPLLEDVAESFLPWFAVRHRPERLSAGQRAVIETTIPVRLEYFDEQRFAVD